MKAHLDTFARIENLAAIRTWLDISASFAGLLPDLIQDVILATDEAASNIILHGYQTCGAALEIETEASGDTFLVRLRDHAPRFDPTSLPPTNVKHALEADAPEIGGFGVHMMRHLVHEMQYRYTAQGENELTLVWKISH